MKFKVEKKFVFEVFGLDASRTSEIYDTLVETIKKSGDNLNIGRILDKIWNSNEIAKKKNEKLFAVFLLGVEMGKYEVIKVVVENVDKEKYSNLSMFS